VIGFDVEIQIKKIWRLAGLWVCVIFALSINIKSRYHFKAVNKLPSYLIDCKRFSLKVYDICVSDCREKPLDNAVAGAILYAKLNIAADESLYRIHLTSGPSMFSVLLKESLPILGGLVVANLLALFVANRIWFLYVNGILVALRDLLSRTRDLDLQADLGVPTRHPVLARALAWRSAERARHLALRESLEIIEKAAASPASSNNEFRACLLALGGHLPAPDR